MPDHNKARGTGALAAASSSTAFCKLRGHCLRQIFTVQDEAKSVSHVCTKKPECSFPTEGTLLKKIGQGMKTTGEQIRFSNPCLLSTCRKQRTFQAQCRAHSSGFFFPSSTNFTQCDSIAFAASAAKPAPFQNLNMPKFKNPLAYFGSV